MEITAKLNNLRISPRKARLVANLVRKMSIAQAKAQLKLMPKKSAEPILKLLNSAIANAKHNFSSNENDLYIINILVDAGAMIKRWMPRAMGRATSIRKRTCHINVILGVKDGTEKIKSKKITSDKQIKDLERVDKNISKPLVAGEKHLTEEANEGKKDNVRDKEERPFGASGAAKKRLFSRQTFGNIKKAFRRKSI